MRSETDLLFEKFHFHPSGFNSISVPRTVAHREVRSLEREAISEMENMKKKVLRLKLFRAANGLQLQFEYRVECSKKESSRVAV